LEILARYNVRATFFQCGANVLRLPHIAREVVAAGHEVGNHTYSHPQLHFRSSGFIKEELTRAQDAIRDTTAAQVRWFRPPLGLRWFGLVEAEQTLNLRRVLWTHGGNDWYDGPDRVVAACTASLRGGAILCLHDGRDLISAPEIENTVHAVERLVPGILEKGFSFLPMSNLVA